MVFQYLTDVGVPFDSDSIKYFILDNQKSQSDIIREVNEAVAEAISSGKEVRMNSITGKTEVV